MGLDFPNTLAGFLPSQVILMSLSLNPADIQDKNLPSCKLACFLKSSYATSAPEGTNQDRAKGFSLITDDNSSCLSPVPCFRTAPQGSFIPAPLASPANRLTKKQRAQGHPLVFGGDDKIDIPATAASK